MEKDFKPEFDGKGIWMYWPDDNARMFKENVENGFMACGLPDEDIDLGDLDQIGVRKIKATVEAEYGKTNPAAVKLMTDIYARVKEGDFVIARNGFDTIVGIGIVTSDYYYDEDQPLFNHCRKVEWINTDTWTFPEELKRGGKWHRVTLIDQHYRYIAEELITAICEGKSEEE